MQPLATKATPASDDRRWKLGDATMRKHGNESAALVASLHTVQESFGYSTKLPCGMWRGLRGSPTARSTGLLDTVGDAADINQGETTADGKVSLLTARCVGSYGLPPGGAALRAW